MSVLAMSLTECSAKARNGPPLDELADLALETWAGVVPLRIVAGEAEDDPQLRPGQARSPAVERWVRRWRDGVSLAVD